MEQSGTRARDEEDEGKRKSGSGVDFENIHTYLGIISVFVIVISGTVLYSFRFRFVWFPPFIILTYGLAMLVVTLLNTRQLRNSRRIRPHAVGAGWIWLLWIVYGTVFKDVDFIMHDAVGFIQSALAVGIVMTTYWTTLRTKTVFMHLVVLAMVFLLFLPHPDSVTDSMDRLVLFIKTIFFFAIYILTDMSLVMEVDYFLRTADATRSKAAYMGPIYNTERVIVQSAWILIVSRYMLVGIAFQIFPILVGIWSFSRHANETSTRDVKFKSMEEGSLRPSVPPPVLLLKTPEQQKSIPPAIKALVQQTKEPQTPSDYENPVTLTLKALNTVNLSKPQIKPQTAAPSQVPSPLDLKNVDLSKDNVQEVDKSVLGKFLNSGRPKPINGGASSGKVPRGSKVIRGRGGRGRGAVRPGSPGESDSDASGEQKKDRQD